MAQFQNASLMSNHFHSGSIFIRTTSCFRIYYILVHVQPFLGAFAELWQVAVSFVISVFPLACPSAWNNSAPTGRIFMKFDIWVFFENAENVLVSARKFCVDGSHSPVQILFEKGTEIPDDQLCTVAPSICRFSVGNLLFVALLVPRILRWLLDFGYLCTSCFIY
jgi:hypothetical protein